MSSNKPEKFRDPAFQQMLIDIAKLKQDVKWLKTLIQYIILPLLLLILGILLKATA